MASQDIVCVATVAGAVAIGAWVLGRASLVKVAMTALPRHRAEVESPRSAWVRVGCYPLLPLPLPREWGRS